MSNNLSYINSQTAKNGYMEEELVCSDLNSITVRQSFLPMLGNSYNECNRINGSHKCDIQSTNQNLKAQVKKYKIGQFQQLDRHLISDFLETIPELDEISQILINLIELPLLPNGTHVDKSKQRKKLCSSNYDNETLDNFLVLFNNFKRRILEYAFYGNNNEMKPDYLIGVEYKKEKRVKIVTFKIEDIIDNLEKLDFKISPKKTVILLGDKGIISLQRKGGDSGKKTSNHLQIKIKVSYLIDNVHYLEHIL